MKLKYSHKISLKVILLTLIMMLYSFLPDYLHNFLGDWTCEGSGVRIDGRMYQYCNYADCGLHQPTLHWGYRHWLFLTMSIVLTIIQIIDICETKN